MRIGAISASDAIDIASWSYPPPYDFYNMSSGSTESFFNPDSPYYSVLDDRGELIGFLSIGIESRVPGGNYFETAVDIGIGLRPDQTGQGLGRKVLQQFIEEVIVPHTHPSLLRATIAAFNQRSLRTFLALGFQESARFITRIDDRPFEWIVVTKRIE